MPDLIHAIQPTIRNPLGERRVSEAVYWAHYYEQSDVHYEWNDGRLEEKPVSDYLTIQVYAWFVDLLLRFLTVQPMADLIFLEMGFRLALPHKTVIRKPDLGVVRRDNPNPIRPLDNKYQGVFDVCVEALSDTNSANRRRDQITKRDEYAAGGVAEYFILHHEQRYQAFYTLTNQGVYRPIPPRDGVIHSLALPGFCVRATDLARRPSIESLRGDPVYQAFIFPEWQSVEQRAKAETLMRQEAEQRAKDAEQEIIRLRAELERLRSTSHATEKMT